MDCKHPLYQTKRIESTSALLIVENIKGKLTSTNDNEFENFFKCTCGKKWSIDGNLPIFLKKYEEKIREEIFKTKV